MIKTTIYYLVSALQKNSELKQVSFNKLCGIIYTNGELER